jgi:hypothetical protein
MRGSIRKRGVGSWELQLELERVAGKRRRRFVTFRGTYKEAQRELAKLLTAADAGTLPDPTQMTVGEYVRAYLDNALHLSPKTKERYLELGRHQIIPHLEVNPQGGAAAGGPRRMACRDQARRGGGRVDTHQ